MRLADTHSTAFTVLSGVPQGSHLAPFLFNLFLNNICEVIPTKCLMFADDIKIVFEIASVEDCNRLQETINYILVWCQLNSMDLNANKSAVITYSIIYQPIILNYILLNTTLTQVNKFKDLGVIMSSNFSLWEHITHIYNRANSLMCFLLRSSRDFQSRETITILFKTLVRPILEYSSEVWNPYQFGHIDAQERIQVRLLRFIGLRLGYQYRT